MRRSGNIFESDCGRGTGIRNFSGSQILTLVLGVISLIAVVGIIVDFERVTAKIAVGVVQLLTAGLPVLIVVLVIMVLIGRVRWWLRRSFWGW